MSARPRDVQPGLGVLESGRLLGRLTPRELWLRYLGLGGDATVTQVEHYLEETQAPNRREYNLLVDAVNERLMDVGLFPRLAYAT
jgi:hypothetical protein